MDKFKFADTWDQIAAGRDKIFPSTASKMMADRIRKFLSRRLGPGVLKEAAWSKDKAGLGCPAFALFAY
jgi:hypothetical protein